MAYIEAHPGCTARDMRDLGKKRGELQRILTELCLKNAVSWQNTGSTVRYYPAFGLKG